MRSQVIDRRSAPKCQGKSPDQPPTTVRAAQCAGGRPHLAAGLQDSWKYANIHADLGVIRGIPASSGTTSTRFSGDMLRGGINYRFNWTFWDLLTGRARL